MKVRKLHTRIKDVRQDFLKKTTTEIINRYDGIVLEDLNVKGMMKNHRLARSIADASWSEFRRQLEYKAKWCFKHFVLIDRWDPTSKTCSNCDHIQDMSLNKRQFNCVYCGTSIDRDRNAAINICRLGHSRINACGVGGLLSTLKQEKECSVN
jgi:putative transposase